MGYLYVYLGGETIENLRAGLKRAPSHAERGQSGGQKTLQNEGGIE